MPSDIEPLREYLGISYSELFKSCLLIDFWTLNEEVEVVAPGSIHEVGQRATWDYPFGANNVCLFLKDGECSIHEVKPFECKMTGHNKKKYRRSIAKVWQKDDTKIIDLLRDIRREKS